MSARNLRWGLLALAAADLLFFGGWIAAQEHGRRSGVTVHLPVRGYDPRDLLYGHYVRFQLVAEAEAARLGGGERYCLASDAQGLSRVVRIKGAGDLCTPFLARLSQAPAGRGSAALFGVDRFYVDERHQARIGLVTEGARTYLVATVDGQGRIHPVDLVLNGASVR